MNNPGGPNLKFLLVDDDPDTRQLVKKMIEGSGHFLQTASNGQDALRVLQDESFHVILLDILMPEMDGMSLLEIIRRTSQVPILMLTAVSHSEIMQQCYILGADDYVIKPFSRDKLLDRIIRLVNKTTRKIEREPASWTNHYWLDTENHLLVHDGTAINLTEAETRILERLMDAPNQELSEAILDNAGWGAGDIAPRAMEERVLGTIKGLQVKVEEDASNPRILIITPRGYMFTPE